MTRPLFSGVITAMITPFRDGNVDYPALKALIERQIKAGVQGLVPVGTTGESATLTYDEHKEVVAFTVRQVAGRVRVIAGAGANETVKAVELVAHAKAVGADGALVVTPYYNKPSQAGLRAHYEVIANAVELPIVLYNVPGRTGVDLANETVEALARHPNIVGIKDATGDLERLSLMRLLVPSNFSLISGDDPTYLGYFAHGGGGVISVSSNVAPEAMVAQHQALLAGRLDEARDWQDRLIRLHKAMFLDSSPSPAKFALAALGLSTEEIRLPLLPCKDEAKAAILSAMREAGLNPEA